MFFGTLFGMSSKMTCVTTSFTTIFFFLQYLHCATFSTSPFEFSLFSTSHFESIALVLFEALSNVILKILLIMSYSLKTFVIHSYMLGPS